MCTLSCVILSWISLSEVDVIEVIEGSRVNRLPPLFMQLSETKKQPSLQSPIETHFHLPCLAESFISFHT
jgi:hypothetical protein